MFAFSNGIRVEETSRGLKIITENGNIIEIDRYGNLINSLEVQLKYFFLMGKKEIQCVKEWYDENIYLAEKYKEFFVIVGEALKQVNYGYKIATIEPSLDETGRIYYWAGKEVARGLTFDEWSIKAEEFAKEYNSGLANLYELFLWYAYRIVKGYWTLEYVCEDSSSKGNYRNSFNDFEVSGKRKVAEATDGIGNTFKIVKIEDKMALIGGCCYDMGYTNPVGSVCYRIPYDDKFFYASGVIVLREIC